MSLTQYEILKNKAITNDHQTILFLLESSHPVAFPMFIVHQAVISTKNPDNNQKDFVYPEFDNNIEKTQAMEKEQFENKELAKNHKNYVKLQSFSFFVSIYFDVEHLVQIKFNYMVQDGYNSNLVPEVYITNEPLYEYGNEEVYLPKIEDLQSIQSEEGLLSYIRHNLYLFSKQYQIDNIEHPIYETFLTSWDDLLKNKDKTEEQLMQENDYINIQLITNTQYMINKLSTYENKNHYWKNKLKIK